MHNAFLLLLSLVALTFATVPGEYGYIDTDPTIDGKIFYWMFPSEHDASTDPTLFCMMGALTENGPIHINLSTGQEYLNPFGWNKRANLVYVDQPYNVGFSTADTADPVHTEAGVMKEMDAFFNGFFTKYKNLLANELFISGESFGGHYVPTIVRGLLNSNEAVKAGTKSGYTYNLKGAAIGNGWFTPQYQEQYSPFALMNQLVSTSTARHLNETYKVCADLIVKKDWMTAEITCGGILQDILARNPGINLYNIHAKCNGPLCYDFSKVDAWLDAHEKEMTGSTSIKFQECDGRVNQGWEASDMLSSFEYNIKYALSKGIRVLHYHGDYDLICNWWGGRFALESLDLIPKNPTLKPYDSAIPGGASPAGWTVTQGLLTYAKISKAGHMVPMDQPENALDMIYRLVDNKPFA